MSQAEQNHLRRITNFAIGKKILLRVGGIKRPSGKNLEIIRLLKEGIWFCIFTITIK
jgi:hypothetical protein